MIGEYLLLPPVWPIDARFLLGLINHFRLPKNLGRM
jgi:hypothetical protein